MENKTKKVTIGILAGCERTMYVLIPLLVAALWFSKEISELAKYLLIIVGGVASLFRAIKVGWINGRE